MNDPVNICDNCGSETENEPAVLCDECDAQDRLGIDHLKARVAELEAVLLEVVTISDRKHDAWDRAHALLNH